MKYLIYISLVLVVSCQSKQKSPISGEWVFEKNELYPGVETNALQDSLLLVLDEQQKGLTLTFDGKIFKVTQLKTGREEFIAEQPYELSEGNKALMLKNRVPPNDTFPIVQLTDSILKVNMFRSNEGYPVFRKKN